MGKVMMFTPEENRMLKENEERGICVYCFEYSGYNPRICGKKAKKVKCDVVRVVERRRRIKGNEKTKTLPRS